MCDVDEFYSNFIVPLGESNEFYLHLFGAVDSNSDTTVASLRAKVVKGNENRFGFWYQDCSDFDSKRQVDVFGICDPTTPLKLQKRKWNKIHVTTRRSPNVGQFGAIERNDHCPYAEDVRCIIIEIAEKPSVLRLRAFASVNCISGKIPHCGSLTDFFFQDI